MSLSGKQSETFLQVAEAGGLPDQGLAGRALQALLLMEHTGEDDGLVRQCLTLDKLLLLDPTGALQGRIHFSLMQLRDPMQCMGILISPNQVEYLAARTVGRRGNEECKKAFSCPFSTSTLTDLASVMQEEVAKALTSTAKLGNEASQMIP